MTLHINLGPAPQKVPNLPSLWECAVDRAEFQAGEDIVAEVYAEMLSYKMGTYKTSKGLRSCWFRETRSLQKLADINGGRFDELASEFATHLEMLAQSDRADTRAPKKPMEARKEVLHASQY